MSKLLEAVIRQADERVRGMEDRHVKAISSIFDTAYNRLEKQLYAIFEGEEIPNSPLQKSLILKGILQELTGYLELLNPAEIEQYKEKLRNLLEEAYRVGLDLSEESFKAIDKDAPLLNAGVNFDAVADIVENSSDRLKNHTESFKQRAIGIIGYQLTVGGSTRNMARLLRAELGITKGRAEAIARTETLSALNESVSVFFEKQGVEYIQVFATADDRLCPFCATRNQSIYKLGEISLPFHVRCRCYQAPVRPEWLDAGLIDREFAEDFYKEGIAEVKSLNNGVAPFEKAAGIEKPPKPVWKPGGQAEFPSLQSTAPVSPPPSENSLPIVKLPPVSEEKPKIKNNRFEVNRKNWSDLQSLGEDYFKENFKSTLVNRDSSNILRLQKKFEAAKARMERELNSAENGEIDRNILTDFIDSEAEYERAKSEDDIDILGMQDFRNKIIRQNGISKREAATQVKSLITMDESIPKEMHRDVLNTMADIYQLTGGKGFNRLRRLIIDEESPDRAYSAAGFHEDDPDTEIGYINIAHGKPDILYHETFHQLEDYEARDFKGASESWRDARAFSMEPKKLSELTGYDNYRDDEVALEDTWVSPYVGKDYGKNRGTEVLAMGGERFYSAIAMSTFFKEDPEHFYYTLGVILSK